MPALFLQGPKFSEVTVNGIPVKAVAGQKVSQVMNAARVKVTYSCRKGENLEFSFSWQNIFNLKTCHRFVFPIMFIMQPKLNLNIFAHFYIFQCF